MAKEQEIAAQFWKALKSDMVVMLGLTESRSSHAQPMTAQLDEGADEGPIYFFSSKETELVGELGAGAPAAIQFAAKGHELFATVEGRLIPDNDRATIDRLWNPYVAAWYEDGKDDPKLQLLRFEPGDAQIWLNENSLFAGIKTLLGRDPKTDYKDKVAEVSLG